MRAQLAVGALKGLIHCGEDLARQARLLAPLEFGPLRESAKVVVFVDGAEYEGAATDRAAIGAVRAAVLAGRVPRMSVEVSFNTVYAARQHEELTWHHPIAGRAKYLEAPFLANADRYGVIIGRFAQLEAGA